MNRKRNLIPLLIGFLGVAGSQTSQGAPSERVPQSTAPSPQATQMPYMAPSLTHTFSPVNPRWVVQENYLKPSLRDGLFDGHITLKPRSEAEKQTLYRELRYFEPGHLPRPLTFLELAHELELGRGFPNDNFVKLLLYRPNGALLSQTDRDARTQSQWAATYYASGRLATLTYRQDTRSLAGDSSSPDGKVQSHFVGGEGTFTTWDEDGSVAQQQWLRAGHVYLERRYRHSRLQQTTLALPASGGDELTFTAEEEVVQSNGLSGRKRAGTQGFTYVTPKSPIWGVSTPDGPRPSATELANKSARESKRYAFLRREFMERYAAFLPSLGQTLASLSLAELRPAPTAPLSVEEANSSLRQAWADLTEDAAEDRLQWPLVGRALAQGATDFDLKTPVSGDTPLHEAARFNDAATVQLLLKAGVPVDLLSGNGETPLFQAAGYRAEGVVPLLLGSGAKVNAVVEGRYSKGETPLHTAAAGGAAGIVSLLLAAGADANAIVPATQWTPLHVAALNNAPDAVELLLAAGADLNAQSLNGSTPLDYAVEMRADKVESLLVAHGARHNIRR